MKASGRGQINSPQILLTMGQVISAAQDCDASSATADKDSSSTIFDL
jgi:hypothetical protein